MQTATLPRMYRAAAPYRPDCRNVSDWRENVLNVVNPPQSPTVAKRSHPPCGRQPESSPMANDPMTLTRKVAMSDDQFKAVKRIEMPYLSIAPKAPPSPTRKMLRIIAV